MSFTKTIKTILLLGLFLTANAEDDDGLLGSIIIGVAFGIITGGIGAAVVGASVGAGMTAGAISSGIMSAKNGSPTVAYSSDVYHNVNDKFNENDNQLHNDKPYFDLSQTNENSGEIITKFAKEAAIIHKRQKYKFGNGWFFKTNTNVDHKTLKECNEGAFDAYWRNKAMNSLVNLFMPPSLYGDSEVNGGDFSDYAYEEVKRQCAEIYEDVNFSPAKK